MNYKIDNIPITAFGALPSKGNQHFALVGMLDLPKRIGETLHDWGTSIEPFVSEEDIELDGRTLTLHVAMKSDRIDAFKAACLACKTLSYEYDSFDVVCRDTIIANPVGEYHIVIVRFWQNDFSLQPITIIPSLSGVHRLDNFDFQRDFGIYIARSSNLSNTASRIEVDTTEFYTRTNYRGLHDITLNCAMRGSSFADLHRKMQQFHSVLMQPGIRTLTLGNKSLDVYFKHGITVNVISEQIASFILRATCI